MKTERKQLSGTHEILAALCDELAAAIAVLEGLDDEVFTEPSGKNGSIGAHFRHNIELIKAVFDGLSEGKVDHAARLRDPQIETEREAGVAAFRNLIERCETVTPLDLSAPLVVMSESVPGLEFASSFGRELEFAISHTVHHHALIAERLRQKGIVVDPMFGVAAATKRHWGAAANTDTSTKL